MHETTNTNTLNQSNTNEKEIGLPHTELGAEVWALLTMWGHGGWAVRATDESGTGFNLEKKGFGQGLY